MNTTGHVKTKPREHSVCSTGKAETVQSKSCDFGPGDQVWARDICNNSAKWISEEVLQSVSPVSYMIQLAR